MNFKTEYKNEIQKISPTEEQCERIRSGVMRKLAETAPEKRKKPLYLKIAAVSGTAVCAAALLIVVFTGKHFIINSDSKNEMTGNNYGNATAAGEDLDAGFNTGGAAEAPGNNITDSMPNSISPSSSDRGSTGGSILPGVTADPQSPNSEGIGGASSPNIPYLTFSEDKTVCSVTQNGETADYQRTAPPIDSMFISDLSISADSDLDIELFVQFDENKMTIFFKDGSLFGVYIK